MINTVINWDCLEIMKRIPDWSIDCIITDPPYWSTACRWDHVIPFDLMWAELKRIIKPNGAIVLFGSEPFSSALRMSNIKMYKYDWVWEKSNKTGHLNIKRRPFFNTENIIIFNTNSYNPQWILPFWKITKRWWNWDNYWKSWKENLQEFTNYPTQIIKYKSENKTVHPTQKPVALIEYLIKTYSLENEIILDFTSGSGTTWIAAQNTNRNYILIEKDEWYYNISKERLLKNKKILWSI